MKRQRIRTAIKVASSKVMRKIETRVVLTMEHKQPKEELEALFSNS